MSQRVMIAMAIACRPKLLIADEPTTALDVTIRAQIIELLLDLQQRENMALLLITHDLALVAEAAHHIIVMYAGRGGIRQGGGDFPCAAPSLYPALLRALPEFAADKARPASLPGVVPGKYDRPTGCLLNPRCPYANERCRNEEPELRSIPGRQVKCHTPLDDAGGRPYEPESTFTAGDRPEEALPGEKGLFAPERLVKALDGVSFTTERGKTLAVVGESGCGKSTLGRLLTMIEVPTGGELYYQGQDLLKPDVSAEKLRRQKIQIVFQNPYGSLNPRKKVGQILEEPLLINTSLSAAERRKKRWR